MRNHIEVSYSGTSMSPLLRGGDVLIAETTPFEDLKQKDIIYFKIPHSEEKGVHRIIKIDFVKKHVKTKGDGALIADPFNLHPKDIIGKIVSYGRDNKSVKLTDGKLFTSYLYSKLSHPYRKIKNILKTQTIFRD